MVRRFKLPDMMDLDYLIHLEREVAHPERNRKNRAIYREYALEDENDETILMAWLGHQRKRFRQQTGHGRAGLLPSDILRMIYRGMILLLTGFGFVSGAGIVISFLTYQGDIPVNVTVFILLFMVVPFGILVVTLLWLLLRRWRRLPGLTDNSLIFRGFAWLMFDVLPDVFLKTGRLISGRGPEKTGDVVYWVRMKFRDYQPAFFWPFFMLSSLTGLFFSAGLLTGTFFKVLTSDVAFGWQSTMISSAAAFHRFVSAAALPWSWLVPVSISHPGLEQIEGTRIVLKEGITVLATSDLVSWWPFLCLGILCYGIIPRLLVTGAAFLKNGQTPDQFDLGRLRYRQLVISMRSPSMDIDAKRNPVPDGKPPSRSGSLPSADTKKDHVQIESVSGKTAVLASLRAYPEEVVKELAPFLEGFLGRSPYPVHYIRFDFQADRDRLIPLVQANVLNGIILQEVWQPPIRGLLHYLDQVQTGIFSQGHLWILLTPDTGDLTVPVKPDDINCQVWEQALIRLGNPNIEIMRYQP